VKSLSFSLFPLWAYAWIDSVTVEKKRRRGEERRSKEEEKRSGEWRWRLTACRREVYVGTE
jgi:hypothetical protein